MSNQPKKCPLTLIFSKTYPSNMELSEGLVKHYFLDACLIYFSQEKVVIIVTNYLHTILLSLCVGRFLWKTLSSIVGNEVFSLCGFSCILGTLSQNQFCNYDLNIMLFISPSPLLYYSLIPPGCKSFSFERWIFNVLLLRTAVDHINQEEVASHILLWKHSRHFPSRP